MKNIFNKRKDSSKKSDVYNEGVNFDMFSVDELMKKSVDELKKLLADESLFPYGDADPVNTDLIRRICVVISKKEKTSNRVMKTATKKAWKSFKSKYITPEPERTLIEAEIPQTKIPKKLNFTPVFTALAAAATVFLVMKIPEKPLESPTAPTTIIESIEAETPAFVKPNENTNSWSIVFDGIPDGFAIVREGTIIYDDKSKKQYTIYSSGNKLIFISILTNNSEDINSPSENEINPFDIFTYAKLGAANIKNGDEYFNTWTIDDTKIVVCGDFTNDELKKFKYSVSLQEAPTG